MRSENVRLSKRIAVLVVALIACVGCDQSTKFAAKRFLEPGEVHSYLGDTFRIAYAENSGAFLGLGGALPGSIRTALFVVIAAGFIAGLAIYALRKRSLNLAELSAVALMVGGGVGNLIDRVMNDGAVVDFLNVGIGPVRTGIFNVADMALMLGVAVFLLSQRKLVPT